MTVFLSRNSYSGPWVSHARSPHFIPFQKSSLHGNHELLTQFASLGLTINEGIAIDARLVQSASRPLSEDKLKEDKDKARNARGQAG
jgi:hypothetical protein